MELAKLQQVLSSVLAQNEDLRRNDSLKDLRSVLDKVKSSLENENDMLIEKTSSSKFSKDTPVISNLIFHIELKGLQKSVIR